MQEERKEERRRVVLTKSGLEHDIKVEGMTRKEMSEKYGIPVTQINKALKQVGLEKIKPTRVLFEIAEEPKEDKPEQCLSEHYAEVPNAPMHVAEDAPKVGVMEARSVEPFEDRI